MANHIDTPTLRLMRQLHWGPQRGVKEGDMQEQVKTRTGAEIDQEIAALKANWGYAREALEKRTALMDAYRYESEARAAEIAALKPRVAEMEADRNEWRERAERAASQHIDVVIELADAALRRSAEVAKWVALMEALKPFAKIAAMYPLAKSGAIVGISVNVDDLRAAARARGGAK